MISNPLVNIIIPCYNAEKYIEKCILSIIQNEYDNLNIICINDGSNDDTLHILKNLSKLYPYLRIIDKLNGGPSSARNAGLDFIVFSKESFVLFVDADDWIENDYIKNLVDFAINKEADIVCGNYFFDGHGCSNPCYKYQEDYTQLNSYESLLKLLDDKEIDSMSHHKLFRSILFHEIRYPEECFFLEDTATLYKVFLKAKKVLLTNYCGYHYNQENLLSIMKTYNNAKILSGWKALRSIYEYHFNEFDYGEKLTIKQKVVNLISDNFLELYPRFDVRKDKIRLKSFLRFIKNNSIIKRFIPTNRKLKIKRIMFLAFPHLYRCMFRCFIFIRGTNLK